MFYQNAPYNQAPQSNPHSQSQYNPFNWNNTSGRYKQPRRPRGLGSCLSVLVCVVVLIGVGVFAFQHFQSQPPSFFFQPDLVSVNTLLIPGLITVGALLFFAAVSRMFRGTILGKAMERALGLLICAIVGVVIFWAVFINPNIGMTRTGFIRTSVTVTTGDTIRFKNPADGARQILCVGRDRQCHPGSGDPAQLDQGLVIQPGQIVSVVFNTAGDYQITSKTTAHMNITITVNEPGDGG